MYGTITVLNEIYKVSDSSEFEIKQLENGNWRITIDGVVKYEGEFAPSHIEIED